MDKAKPVEQIAPNGMPAAAPPSAPSAPARPGARGAKALRIVTMLLVAASIIIAILIHQGRGQKVKITDQEEVYYSVGATEQDALRLGQALRDMGYFDNASEKSVQVSRDGQTIIVKFVVHSGAWNDARIVSGFGAIREHLAAKTFPAQAVEVRLCDDHLNTRKALK